MKYLENNICEFTPLKDINFDEKKKIISGVLFKMGNSGYKSFKKYLDGIKIINDNLKKDGYHDFRLFIDNTIYEDKEIYDVIYNYENVIPVLFKCNDFIINNHHIGLIGTLIRFFPLFDFPNNDANIVCTIDTDVGSDRILATQKNIIKDITDNNLQDKIYIAWDGNYYHVNNYSIEMYEHNNKKYMFPYCIADKIIGFKHVPPDSLIKYFDKLKLYMNENYPKEILSNYYISQEDYKIRCEHNICFGVDEYYLNKILFKYLLYNDLPFCFSFTYNISIWNYHKNPFSPEFVKPKKIKKDEYIKEFSKLTKKFDLDVSSREKYSKMDKILYIRDSAQEISRDQERMIIDYRDKIKKMMDTKSKIFIPLDYYMFNEIDYMKYIRSNITKFVNIDQNDIYNNTLIYKI